MKDDSFLVYCDDCKEEIDPNHPSYGCYECDQCRAHVRFLITEIQLDERERHEHFTHHHFLVLLESERSDDTECYLCKKSIIQGTQHMAAILVNVIPTNPVLSCQR